MQGKRGWRGRGVASRRAEEEEEEEVAEARRRRSTKGTPVDSVERRTEDGEAKVSRGRRPLKNSFHSSAKEEEEEGRGASKNSPPLHLLSFSLATNLCCPDYYCAKAVGFEGG